MENNEVILLKNELEQARKELDQWREKYNEIGFLYQERTKELACHNAITRILGLGLTPAEAISKILNEIPPALQYPEYAMCR